MTDQTPKPLEDILAAVRSTLLPSPDDALVRALVETIEARIEQDRQEIAALRAEREQLRPFAQALCADGHRPIRWIPGDDPETCPVCAIELRWEKHVEDAFDGLKTENAALRADRDVADEEMMRLAARVAELESAIYTRCRWYGPMMPIAEEIERKRNDR